MLKITVFSEICMLWFYLISRIYPIYAKVPIYAKIPIYDKSLKPLYVNIWLKSSHAKRGQHDENPDISVSLFYQNHQIDKSSKTVKVIKSSFLYSHHVPLDGLY